MELPGTKWPVPVMETAPETVPVPLSVPATLRVLVLLSVPLTDRLPPLEMEALVAATVPELMLLPVPVAVRVPKVSVPLEDRVLDPLRVAVPERLPVPLRAAEEA